MTGSARFAEDFLVPELAHAAMVTSTIARGRIVGFELEEARRIPGVLAVFTYLEMAHEMAPVGHLMSGGFTNSSALPLGSEDVHYAGQIVAVVVAESQEAAREASGRVHVHYQAQTSTGVLNAPGGKVEAIAAVRPSHKDPAVGDASQAFADPSAVTVAGIYQTPIQHHNPIELFGTTCIWDGDRLVVYEATRYVDAAQHGLAAQLRMDPGKIRFLCPFIGGHFGSRLALSQYTAPVAIAARKLGRPVRYVATRSEGFTIANHRPDTEHHIRIAATPEGKFTALQHEVKVTTSRFDNFAMEGTDVTASLYAWRNVETKESLVRVDRNTPGPMRAPPEVPYLFALESAVDELAAKLGIDPIELRRRNDTATDPISGKPFIPRPLMECFDAGAKAFDWASRDPKPQSMRDGEWRVGFGCATSVRPMKRASAVVRVSLTADGHAVVETAHHEIGNGIYTVLAMQAAKQLGLNVPAVTVRLGDTALPPAGISGGSSTTTSLVPVLLMGCEQLRAKLADVALTNNQLLAGVAARDLHLQDGSLVAPDGRSVKLSELFAGLGTDRIETVAEAVPDGAGPEALAKLRQGKLVLGSNDKFVRWSYGAQFAEVRVHAQTGEIKVVRMTGAFSAGYIINRLTALSQLKGGMIWGIGSALLEATFVDPKMVRFVNDNLAEYLVATAADSCAVDAILLHADENPSELMGLGELGIIGVNAAIANALHHATGGRYRSLPIRVDDMLPALSARGVMA